MNRETIRRYSFNALRENSAGQIAIQCPEGSPATGQCPKNDLCHDIREDVISSGLPVEYGNSIAEMKDIFNMTTISKIRRQYPSTERTCSEFI
jgi:hypothetical protein